MKKKLFSLLLAAASIVVLFSACGENKASDGNISNGNVTDSNPTSALATLPEEKGPFFTGFETVALDGETYSQKIFEGNKLTMVNIWGTFCSPCINEMPDLEKLSKDYADKNFVIVGIVADTFDYLKAENNELKIADAKKIIEQTGVTYTNLLPSESLNAAKLDYIRTFPTTYFLNEKGELLGEYIGSRTYDQWTAIINSLLAE